MVTLTGSVEAGQRVIAGTAENIVKTSLELGGKAPAIVFAVADLDLAVQKVMAPRVIFSGQVCNRAERLSVDEKIAGRFVSLLAKAMKSVTFGDSMAVKTPDMSSQVSAVQQRKVASMVERAKQQGAKVLAGGAIPKTPSGHFYEPTALGDCTQDMEIVREEVFGPVLPVLTFKDADEAIALTNDCQYGLTSSIFTTNIRPSDATRQYQEYKTFNKCMRFCYVALMARGDTRANGEKGLKPKRQGRPVGGKLAEGMPSDARNAKRGREPDHGLFPG